MAGFESVLDLAAPGCWWDERFPFGAPCRRTGEGGHASSCQTILMVSRAVQVDMCPISSETIGSWPFASFGSFSCDSTAPGHTGQILPIHSPRRPGVRPLLVSRRHVPLQFVAGRPRIVPRRSGPYHPVFALQSKACNGFGPLSTQVCIRYPASKPHSRCVWRRRVGAERGGCRDKRGCLFGPHSH